MWVSNLGCVIVATMIDRSPPWLPLTPLLCASLCACPPEPSGVKAPPPATASPAPAPTPATDLTAQTPPGPADPAPTAAAPTEPKRVDESDPAGVAALSEAERTALKDDCGTFAQQIAKKTKKANNRLEGTINLLEALKDDTSNPTCKTLMQRDLAAYLARTFETAALNDMRMIMVGMSDAYKNNGQLCPGAPPVPGDVAEVKKPGGFVAPEGTYDAKAWSCIGFHLHGRPQRYQYEVKVADPTHFEIIARGYPVPGGPMSELFMRGEVKDDAVPLHSDVFRR